MVCTSAGANSYDGGITRRGLNDLMQLVSTKEKAHNLATQINHLGVRIIADKQDTVAVVKLRYCQVIEILYIRTHNTGT